MYFVNQDDEIKSAVAELKERVIELDSYYTMDGRFREKPLKKPRAIKSIEVWPDQDDLKRFKKMKDIDEVFLRAEQTMVLNRYDGSTVKIIVKDGMVEIHDSRKPGQYTMLEEDSLADTLFKT